MIARVCIILAFEDYTSKFVQGIDAYGDRREITDRRKDGVR